MASSIIHIAVANEINKILNRDSKKLLIGSIAPDISKLIGDTKVKSHFLDELNDDIPNLDRFLDKYKSKLSDDFVMGYYIHLYTDYLWFKYFISEIIDGNYITKLNGEIVKLNGNMVALYIYNDYTNLNIQLIDKYELDLKIFYSDIPYIKPIITEIPMDRLDIILNKAGIIIANTKARKDFVFNIKNIEKFIDVCTKLILSEIEKLNIYN